MGRDTDYAAIAIRVAIEEKFGRQTALDDLAVDANDRTITLRDGSRAAEGTRDHLLAALRKAATYEELWDVLEADANIR